MSVGVNAIDKGVYIFQALRQLEDEWGLTKQHPLFAPGTSRSTPASSPAGPNGVLVPFVISEFMTIEYCVWYHPDEDPEDVKREIETHIDARRAAGPVAARAPAGRRVEAELAGEHARCRRDHRRHRARRTSAPPPARASRARPS